jgi:membrane-associated phospholipid phosphatase
MCGMEIAVGEQKKRSTSYRLPMSARHEVRQRVLGLGAVATSAAAGFAALAAAAARRDTAEADEALRERTAAPPQNPVRRAGAAIAPLGKWWAYLPAAACVSAGLLAAPLPRRRHPGAPRSRRAGAGAVLLTGTVAALLPSAFDRWIPQPPAPPGHRSRRKPVFPSGHAFGPASVALATAYVLAREDLARPALSMPTALAVPLATAGGRILEQKHWASDVLGGYLGGVTVAASCLIPYEAARRR